MDETYTLVKQGPGYTYPFNKMYAVFYGLEKVLYKELKFFMDSVGAAIMFVVFLMFGDFWATFLLTFNVLQILLIVFSSIH